LRPAEADLAAFRIFAHTAAGRRGDHLQPPAGAEQRGSGRKRRAHQIDLPHHLHAAVVDVQRGAGDGDTVIALKRLAVRQSGGRIARMTGVHARARQQLAQQVGITLVGGGAADRDMLGQRLRRVAFNDEQAGGWHWALNKRASSRDCVVKRHT
jgi:hypothetical protein